MNFNTLSRFSNHAHDYHKYRPRYPEAIITYLEQTIGLNANKTIVDIGSGTGIFTELFLRNGYAITAVEPNQQMRAEAEKTLAGFHQMTSTNGTAESTHLEENTIDLITVAQSFHWFDSEKVKKEFQRIAKPGAHVLLIWNILQQRTPFLKAYQELKSKYSDKKPYQKQVDEALIGDFFEPSNLIKQEIYHSRLLNSEDLLGYFRSSSYSPLPGENAYTALAREIDDIFSEFQKDGFVKLEYDSKMYLNASSFL